MSDSPEKIEADAEGQALAVVASAMVLSCNTAADWQQLRDRLRAELEWYSGPDLDEVKAAGIHSVVAELSAQRAESQGFCDAANSLKDLSAKFRKLLAES